MCSVKKNKINLSVIVFIPMPTYNDLMWNANDILWYSLFNPQVSSKKFIYDVKLTLKQE